MFGFKKKEAADFEATIKQQFFQVDEGRRLICVKEYMAPKMGKPFSLDSITDIEIKCDDTVVNKRNLGAAALGGVTLGIGGALLAGTHGKKYIDYLAIIIKTNDFNRPVITIPLIKAKMSTTMAQSLIDKAEKTMQQINILKGDN